MIERIPRKEELKYGKYFLATEAPRKNKNDKFDINISRRKNIFDDESLDVADNVPLDDMDMDGIADYDELDDVDLADALTLDDVESPDPVDIPDPNDRLKIIDSLSDIRKKPKITNDDLEEYDDNEPTPIEDSEDGPTPIEDGPEPIEEPNINSDEPVPIEEPSDIEGEPTPIDEPDNSPIPIEEPSDIEGEPTPIDEPDNSPTPIEEPSDVQVDTPTNDTEPAAIDEPDNGPTPIEEPSDTEDGPAPIEDNGPTPIEEPSDVQVDTPTNDTEPAAIDEPDNGPTPIEEPDNGPTPIDEPNTADNNDGPTPIEEPNTANNGDGSTPTNQQPDTNFNNNNPNNNTNNNQNQQNNQGPGAEYDSTRKYVLFKEYMSLYNALDNYIFKLEDNIKDDIVANQIIKTSVNKLREIKEITYDYIIIKFDNNTYIQSLLFYQNLVTSVQMVFKLLNNIEKKDDET